MFSYEPMTGRSKKLLFVVTLPLVGLATLLAWKAVSRPEPVYEGRPLTSWVEQWRSNRWAMGGSADETRRAEAEAEAAILNTGTNGMEFLLGLMKTREPAIKPWLRKRIPTSWHSRLYLENTATRLQILGGRGLAAYGTNAGHAVPELMVLLSLEMTRNPPDRNNGYLPMWVLGNLGSAAEPAVPLLVQCLTNPYFSIRNEAALYLGIIRQRPEIVVPALTQYLKAKHPDTIGWQVTAIQSIGRFGTNASAAAPTLVALLDDPNPDIRRSATNSLPLIDRTAAERAGIPLPWER